MNESFLLDLDSCPFLRHSDEIGTGDTLASADLRCLAGKPTAVDLTRRRTLCQTVAHTDCPALLAALDSRGDGAWLEMGRSARVVAESCHLAEARLEACVELLEPVLADLFGVGA